MPLTIVPSIDLRGGRVVRLKQGDYGRQVNYDVDPFDVARSFAAAGATWMHIVDLDGAKEGRPVQTELIGRLIASTGLQVEVGGGVRSTDDIRRLLDAGAARVVVGTKAMEDWPWFEQIAHDAAFDSKLVLSVDAKEGVIATRGWTETSGRLATDVAKQVGDWPLAALLYTDVAKDGMLAGPNTLHTWMLVQSGKIPVIASGGVGTIEHIRQLLPIGAWGVIVGRSLYEGTVDLAEAVRVGAGS
ncbi:MAG TPA: 1-(5-phosphoribosyl)-5-[(5-phosphoribosylamino)methylideneamino]imidazole-4-carboxamide isomerase [Humisphaera sp.]|jgi:phosphoribosylformimino-5-aminoimidazole carboxamide ribotide isomerase|nr:1-(5-phosphoribosyl)-5-[(5-phosphoribosylamino)methylideneamino]imidazole-4-carboxamide isomerase [Humisphaera sp.]